MAAEQWFCKIAVLITLLFPVVVMAADPMRPPDWMTGTAAEITAPLPELTLQQISIRSDRSLAVINNQLVSIGDVVDGAQVLAISRERVVVKIRKKVLELSLLNSTRHKPD